MTAREWLEAPERVCPRLAAPAMIEGGLLRMRMRGEDYEVRAPRRFLKSIFKWCNGDLSRSQISRLANDAGLDGSFDSFVDELLAAGLLVDAATYLWGAARVVHEPEMGGRPAPEHVWSALKERVAELPENAVPLPLPRPGRMSHLLQHRESAAGFGAEALSAEQLAGLLASMYGSFGTKPNGTVARSVGSAGAFYALRLFVVLLKPVDRFAEGVYVAYFAPEGQVGLRSVQQGVPTDLLRAFLQPHRLTHATGVAVLAADPGRSELKYRNRSYPFALIEAGSAIQNASLAAAEMDIGWRPLGGFDGRRLGPLLGVDAVELLICGAFGARPQAPLHAVDGRLNFAWHDAVDPPMFHVACASWSRNGQMEAGPSWGRDRDPVRAYDKAVSEAVERAAYRSRRGELHCAAEELQGPWLHPDQLVRYTPAQYRRKEFPFVRFDAKQSRGWVGVTCLEGGRRAWVPSDFVFASGPEQKGMLFRANSSGCASHATRSEAINAAVLELVERDAFLRHWLRQTPGRQVPVDELPVEIREQAASLRERGCTWSLQVLAPCGVPVWMVVVRSERAGFSCVSTAGGLDPQGALESACSEAYTAAAVRLSQPQERRVTVGQVRSPRDHADLHAMRAHFRRLDPLAQGAAPISFAEAVGGWPRGLVQVVDTLQRHGTGPVHLIDLTLPGAPRYWNGGAPHTVRALVPGLIPMTFGAGLVPLGMLGAPPAAGALFPHPFA